MQELDSAVVLMPVNQQQAQMLAALAVACRPYRAPTWDEAGVMANIAKVKDRDLSLVCLAVIQAASDHEAVSPGVIPSNGSHWNIQTKPGKWHPTQGPWCGTCGVAESEHAKTDHEFERQQRPDLNTALIVAEIRDQIAAARLEPADLEPERSTPAPNPGAQAARAALHPDEDTAA